MVVNRPDQRESCENIPTTGCLCESPIQRVLKRLRGVRKTGPSRWKACCPAHDDRHPSLSIEEARDGRVLLHCHAGCSTERVCAAIGLTLKDLFSKSEQPHDQTVSGKIIATYNYTDMNGNLLFQVCRTADKRFFQRRPDGNGCWLNGLGGVKPVLYRLRQVLQAVEKGETVFIPEGEKDVDNLVQLGLTATTNPMGAGKWQESYSEILKGANVVILPDNDEPGRNHAVRVTQSLAGTARSIKVLGLPNLSAKGDISDWLSNGGTKEELLRLVAETPEWESAGKAKPIIVQLAEVEPQEVVWLWEPYIPLGKLTILEGDPGVGKTWLALQLTAIISLGEPFPVGNRIPTERREPSNVIYLSAEDGLGDTLRPRLDKAGADVSRVYALTGWEDTNPENGRRKTGSVTLATLDVIETALRQVKPVLVVIDPLQAYLGANVDMHRANEVRPVLSGLAALAERYKCAVLCIRHLAKSPQDRAVYRGLGSIDFAAAARSILLVGQHPDDERKRVMAQSKSSLAVKGASIAFELREDGFFWCGLSDVTAEALLAAPKSEEEKSALEEAIDFLREILADGPRPSDEIMKEARKNGIAEKTLRRAKQQLGVEAKRKGIPGGRGKGVWQWHLGGQDDDLNQSSIRAQLDHLNRKPETLEPQGFQTPDLDSHMTSLIERPQIIEPQRFQRLDLDGQTEPLGDKDSKCHNSHLNKRERKGWEVLEL